MHDKRLLIIPAALTTAALALTACGGEDDAGGSEPAAASADVPAGVAEQYATIGEEVAAEGGETQSGAWRIAYIVEPAAPWFVGERFRKPAPGETHHIEILPIEAETGRVVPEVPIRVQVIDESGKVIDAKPLHFYYAEFFHYANNFSVPHEDTYTLRSTIKTPSFGLHGD